MRKILRVSLGLTLAALFVALLRPNIKTGKPLDNTGRSKRELQANKTDQTEPETSTETSRDNTHNVMAAFTSWSEQFITAPPSEQHKLNKTGVALAKERRALLENLIKTDPRRAIEQAIPDNMRRRLPLNIQDELEERVAGRGFFGVIVVDYPEQARREVRREIVLNGRRYEAYVYGRRLAQSTLERETFWGIAVGSSLAIHETPVRALSAEESAGLDATGSCPVSGLEATTHGTPAFGEVAGRVESFCGTGHLAALNKRLAADGGIGADGEEPPIAHDGWTQGPRTVLFMRVTYPDDPTEAITEAAAYTLMDAASAWYAETSYNTTWLVSDVTPLMILPQTKAWYCENGDGYILSDAREIARSYGFDTDNYNLDVVRFPSPGGGCSGYNYGGKAYVRGKGVWMLSNSTGTMVHELGHNYGVWHANFWTGVNDGIINQGTHVEYGNPYDVMGSSGSVGQFNVVFKNILDWTQDAYVQTVVTNGTYRLFTYDVAALTAGQKYALKIRKDYDRNYWTEFRRKIANQWFLNGVMLNWDAWDNGVTNSGSGTHLLDTTPGTPAGNSSKDDSAVVIGRTYSDVPSGVHITPIARGDNSLPENWIDVVVNLGRFPSNSAPSFTLIADRTNQAANSLVNFSAVATDPDGDALAYSWDFGDNNFGPNSPNVSKFWSAAGEYVVRCTVSDMKGGVETRFVVIRIGSPSTFRAGGRITVGGIPLEGARVHNGLTGASYRGAYTDSDGYYTLTGLAAGSYNLSAVKYGYTPAASGWGNPVTVGPSQTNLHFSATALPAVGFSLLDTNMSEAALNPGSIRLTRKGGTNTTLAVRLNRTGSAVFGTDYTMSPAPSGTPLQFTFPVGSTNLDITLTPVADGSSEGPEQITLTLIENASYALAESAEVTLRLMDDDTVVRPTVAVSAANSGGATADNIATESGSDPGVFLLTRSGNIANELFVSFSMGGSATAGVDYTALSGVVSIPAGQTTAVVTFKALDDANVESNETVSVTLLADAAYTVGSPSTATVTIIDDDPVTVTVTATDNVASETSNTGAVVFNRIGSMAANLVVNYALSGSASNGVDYSSLSGAVTIPAGKPNVSLTITPINDSLVEGDESVIVNVLSSAAYNVGNPGGAEVVLQDNEISTVTVTASDSAAAEPGANTGAFRFTRTIPSTNDLTVFYSVSGEALPGADYQSLPGSFTFAAGITTNIVTITPMDDSFVESAERVLVTLLPDPAYVIGTASPTTVTISDDDGGTNLLPAIGFSSASSKAAESDTSVQISVRLSSPLSTNATVNYSVTGGSATGGGSDYTLAAGTLVFTNSEINRTITLSVVNDSLGEINETVIVTLSNPTNAVLDALNSHTYTILDDDGSGTLTVSTPDATANETGLGTATFRITRSGSTSNPLTVFFQVIGSANAPADYEPLATSIVMPGGSNFVDLIIVPINDATDEQNETVTINLLPSIGARLGSPDLATITIVDDDDSNLLPIVRAEAIDAMSTEPGPDTGTFKISRDRDINVPLTINFTIGGTAVNGTDYTNIASSIILPAGVSFTNIVIYPRNDSTFETNETIICSLTVLPAYRVDPLLAVATVTLVDDEIGISVAGSGVAAEDGSSAGEFTISRTGSVASNLTVNFRWAGTATTNEFTSNATNAVIAAGTNSVTLPIFAINDGVMEGIETLVLTLLSNSTYTLLPQNSAAILLVDGDESFWNLWRAEKFSPAEMTQLSVSGADADPDGDRLRNLLEYAYNLDPKSADENSPFSGSIEGSPGATDYVIQFTRRKSPTDLLYQVEVTSDFISWDSSASAAEELLPPLDHGNGVTETARFAIAPGLNGNPQKFVRLKVTLVENP